MTHFVAGMLLGLAIGIGMMLLDRAAGAEPVTVDSADVNRDGTVNVIDLHQVAAHFGQFSTYWTGDENDCTMVGDEYTLSAPEAEMLNLINAYRAANGAPALAISAPLQRAATWKSHDMAEHNYFAHDDLFRSWTERIEDCGQPLNVALGENLGLNWITAQQMFDNWKLAPGHNANMLNPCYRYIGVAYDFHGDGHEWTTDFAAATGPCPPSAPTPTATSVTAVPPSSTPTSTNTPLPPTATASPTMPPSSTATASSTPTSASGSYTVSDLIADSTGDHDGCLSTDPDRGVAGYDWQFGAVQRGTPTASHLTPWWQATIDHCPDGTYDSTPPIPSGAVELRNFRAYALTSTWVPVGSGPQLGQWGNYTIGFNGSCFSGWTAIGHAYDPGTDPVCIAHGWVYPRSLTPDGYQCFVVLIEARGAGFLLNVGLDAYDGETYRGDVGIGRFVRLTSEFSTVGVTSCSESVLTAAGMP